MTDYEKKLEQLKDAEKPKQQTIEAFGRLREDANMVYESDSQYYPEVWGDGDWINKLVSTGGIAVLCILIIAGLAVASMMLQAR